MTEPLLIAGWQEDAACSGSRSADCFRTGRLLAPDGALVLEVPYLAKLVENLEYDTIYHEHLRYLAIKQLVTLYNRQGLRMERIELFPVHGGTIRCVVRHG